MTNIAETPKSPLSIVNRIASIVFAAGILCPVVVFTIADLSSHPAWDWDSSFFGNNFAMPLWVIGFLCCLGTPFLTQLPERRQFHTMLIGIGAYGVVWIVSLIVSVLVFGTGIR
jgi:hypothetical protein